MASDVALGVDERARTARATLDRVQALVAEDLVAVNRVILDKLQSPVTLIPELAGHIIAAGGKRIRPMLTLIAARLCGYRGTRHINLAACVEFIHTATLLHDDVVDESALRRGNATANTLWGNQPSVLVGDFLFSRSFQLMVGDGSLKVLEILSDAAAVIAEGEVMQLVTSQDIGTDEEAYLKVISAKTARLFAAACRLGAIVADRGEEAELALERYGTNIGIAYQLVDDALDYMAREVDLGKTVGDDFQEGKITLPIVLACGRGDKAERSFWRRTLEEGRQGDGDFRKAVALLERHGALTETVERARRYGADAREALAVFGDGREQAALIDVVDFCIDRAY